MATHIIGTFRARASVFDDGARKAAIVLLDLCDSHGSITGEIRRLVALHTDIAPESVLVCATHTHAAPLVNAGETRPGLDISSYVDVLCRKAAGAVFLANSRLSPARGRIADMHVPGIGRPSRIRLRDGSIASLGSTLGIRDIQPEDIESESPHDDSLRLAVFEDLSGKPICSLGNFGCHNNIVLHTTGLNTDFFGYAMDRIESGIGDAFVMSITAGAEGDVQPLAKINHRTWDAGQVMPPGRGDDLAPAAGEILYQGVKRAWAASEPFASTPVTCASERVVFRRRESPRDATVRYVGKHESPADMLRGEKQPRSMESTSAILRGGMQPRSIAAELQLIRLGDLALMGVCGEVFQELGTNLRLRSPCAQTWVISLANDCLCYLMPEWEWLREAPCEKKSLQNDWCITDETAERAIYDAYDRLFQTTTSP